MKEYNAAFFGLYENWFKTVKEAFGEEKALMLFRQVMEKGLSTAYGLDFIKGNSKEFARIVGERDDKVGLHVTFPTIENNKIIYRFHTDPFPNLKNQVNHHQLDDTYISFKMRYILGDEWQYKNTSHIWDGDEFTEFVLWK